MRVFGSLGSRGLMMRVLSWMDQQEHDRILREPLVTGERTSALVSSALLSSREFFL